MKKPSTSLAVPLTALVCLLAATGCSSESAESTLQFERGYPTAVTDLKAATRMTVRKTAPTVVRILIARMSVLPLTTWNSDGTKAANMPLGSRRRQREGRGVALVIEPYSGGSEWGSEAEPSALDGSAPGMWSVRIGKGISMPSALKRACSRLMSSCRMRDCDRNPSADRRMSKLMLESPNSL